MKYTVVKQFSNGFIDNVFKFLFKWVDCGKMFLEFLLSFLEIWFAFFLIFYNAFMYVYYLFLFFIDRSTETSTGYFRIRGTYSGTSVMPKFEVTRGPSTVPPQYGRQAVGKVVETVMAKTGAASPPAYSSGRTAGLTAGSGMKKSAIMEFFSSILDFFKLLGGLIVRPFKKLVLLFDRGAELRKQREAESDKSKSLIDEYIKEYEQKRK